MASEEERKHTPRQMAKFQSDLQLGSDEDDDYDYSEYNEQLRRDQEEEDDDQEMHSRAQSAMNASGGYREAGSSMF